MEFARLAHTFEELERTNSRLALIELLTEPFRLVEGPEEIKRICYLVQGRVAPFFEALEMGMAEKTVARSIALAAHTTPEDVFDGIPPSAIWGWWQSSSGKKQERCLVL